MGGANILTSVEAAALNAQVATTSSMAELDLTLAHLKGVSLHVVFMLIPMIHNLKRDTHAQILRELASIAEAGHLRPILNEQRYSLQQAGEAQARLNSGQGMGKVVIDIEA